MMAFFGQWEALLVLAVILLLFGARKLPALAKSLGQSLTAFKSGTHEALEDKSDEDDGEDTT